MLKPVEECLLQMPEGHRAMAMYIIQEIERAHPHLTLKLAWNMPFFYGKKGVCYINPKKRGVDLGFMYGSSLPKNPMLVVGKRTQIRSLYFGLNKDVDVENMLAVVANAVAHDEKF